MVGESTHIGYLLELAFRQPHVGVLFFRNMFSEKLFFKHHKNKKLSTFFIKSYCFRFYFAR